MSPRFSLLLISTVILLTAYNGFCDEKDLLKSLEVVKANVESGVNLHKYNSLLADAKVELNILKRDENVKPKFLKAIVECYNAYKTAQAYWEMKLDMERAGNYGFVRELENKMQASWHNADELLDKAYEEL